MRRLLLLALTAAALPGPTKAEFKAAVQAMVPEPNLKIRRLDCKSSAQEPTEFACAYDKKVAGAWQKWSTVIARDGGAWKLIDRPGPATP